MNQRFFRARLAPAKLLILRLSFCTLASAQPTDENQAGITK